MMAKKQKPSGLRLRRTTKVMRFTWLGIWLANWLRNLEKKYEGKAVIYHYFRKFMLWIGYRRVLFLPSEKGLTMSDFWSWQYAPNTEKRDYTEHDFPWWNR